MAQDWAAPTVRAEILRAVAGLRQTGVPLAWTSQTIRPGAQPGWSGGDVGSLTIHVLRTHGSTAGAA
eukprot:2776073-Alexandrium_andersonii.AAC.1